MANSRVETGKIQNESGISCDYRKKNAKKRRYQKGTEAAPKILVTTILLSASVSLTISYIS